MRVERTGKGGSETEPGRGFPPLRPALPATAMGIDADSTDVPKAPFPSPEPATSNKKNAGPARTGAVLHCCSLSDFGSSSFFSFTFFSTKD